MRLRSRLIYISTEVIGTKAANEGGLVQPVKHDDFELKPVDGDGLNQSRASDVVESKPVDDDGVDRSRASGNDVDLNYTPTPNRVESTNAGSLHLSEGEYADGTSPELLAETEELERARAVASGREVKLKTEEYSDDYWEGQRAISFHMSNNSINNSSDEEPNTSELLTHSILLASTDECDAELLQHVLIYGGDNDGSLQALADESSLEGGSVHMGVHMGGLQVLTAVSGLVGGVISSRFEPIRFALFGVQAQFSIGGWNPWFVFSLFLLACARAVCYLLQFMHPSWWTQPKKRRKKRGRRNWRRHEKWFHRRRLHVNLVKRCRRRVGNRPPRLDGSRFRSPRDTKHARYKRRQARQRCHREKASVEKEYWEFCESPKPNPTHVDAPVREPLLNWFCFESNSSDDFPATTLDAEESDGWQQYQDKFVEMENHVDNVKRLQARAEAARRPRDGNVGREDENAPRETFFGSRGTSLWSRVLCCWRRTSQHTVVGRFTLVTDSTMDSTHPDYFEEWRSSSHVGGASAQLAHLTNRVSINSDRIRVFDTGASHSIEQRLYRRKQLTRACNDHRLQPKRIEVQSLRRAETQTAVDQTPFDITSSQDLLAISFDDWSSESSDGNSSPGSISESEGGIDDDQSDNRFDNREGELNDVLQFRLRNNLDFDFNKRQLQKERGCLLQREQL